MGFPTFDFDMDQLFTWGFWKRWIIEFLGCVLFGITVGYLDNNAWSWAFSYVFWTSVTSATILSTVTIAELLTKKEKFLAAVMHLVAQGLAANLGCCKVFSSAFSVAKAPSHAGYNFTELLQAGAILEFFAVFLFFMLRTKGADDFPAWLFKALSVAVPFFMNSGACFSAALIWGNGGWNWSIVFGTYVNHILAVYFGMNVTTYIFHKGVLEEATDGR